MKGFETIIEALSPAFHSLLRYLNNISSDILVQQMLLNALI